MHILTQVNNLGIHTESFSNWVVTRGQLKAIVPSPGVCTFAVGKGGGVRFYLSIRRCAEDRYRQHPLGLPKNLCLWWLEKRSAPTAGSCRMTRSYVKK